MSARHTLTVRIGLKMWNLTPTLPSWRVNALKVRLDDVTYRPRCQPAPAVARRCWAAWRGPGPARGPGGGGDGCRPASEPRPSPRPLRGCAAVYSSAGPRCSLAAWGEGAWGDLRARLLRRPWGPDPPRPDPGSLEGWEGELGNAHPWRGRWHSTLGGGVDRKKERGGWSRGGSEGGEGVRSDGAEKVVARWVRRRETKENNGK